MKRTTVLLFLAAAAAACFGQQGRPDPPGRLVDAGGHKVHLFCEGTGTPTVVLEPTMGGFSVDWALVQSVLAPNVRVCSWDRAGSAWSDMTPHFGEFDAAMFDLSLALRNAGVPPPYVLVGEAYGALFARNFQRLHAGEVAGMVLVDSLYEEEATRPAAETGLPVPLLDMSEKNLTESLAANPAAAFTPASRPAVESLRKLPASAQSAHAWAADRWNATLSKLTPAQWAAIMESATTTYDQLYRSRHGAEFPLGNLPLAMIRAAGDAGVDRDATFARLSENGRQVLADGGAYPTPLEQPALVAETILRIVAMARAGGGR